MLPFIILSVSSNTLNIYIYLRLYATLRVMTDFLASYTYIFQPGCCPLSFSIFALSRRFQFATFGALPSWTLTSAINHSITQQIFPFSSLLRPHSSSLFAAPSLLPISVFLKNFNNGPTARSFADKLANHIFSGLVCRLIPGGFSSFLISFLRSFL